MAAPGTREDLESEIETTKTRLAEKLAAYRKALREDPVRAPLLESEANELNERVAFLRRKLSKLPKA